jgi:hypothetical protein
MKKDSLYLGYRTAGGSVGKDMLAADSDGNYVVTIPADAVEVNIGCEWEEEKEEEEEEESPNGAAQITGALAVAVVLNNNKVEIDGSHIEAGGKLDAAANASTVVVTTADGTGSEEDPEDEKEKEDEEEEEKEPEGETEFQSGGKYAVKIDGTKGGKVLEPEVSKDRRKLTFTVMPDEGKQVDSITVSWVTARGVKKTKELEPVEGTDNVFVLNLEDDPSTADKDERDLIAKDGSTVTVSVTFEDDLLNQAGQLIGIDGSAGEPTEKEAFYVEGFSNTVSVTRFEGGSVEQKSRNDQTGNSKFAFEIKNDTGYKAPEGSYTYYKEDDKDGKPTGSGTIEATSGDTYVLDISTLENIKPGTTVEIKAEFPEDSRGIELEGGEADHYTLTTENEKAKVGDEITIKGEAANGYNLGDKITYTYTDKDGETKTGELTAGEDGSFTFEMPADVSEEDGKNAVTFSASAAEKEVPLTVSVENESEHTEIAVETAERMDNGDTISITSKDDSYYIKEVKATAQGSDGGLMPIDDLPEIAVTKNEDGTYTLNADGVENLQDNCASVQLEIKVALKPVVVEAAEAENGEIKVTEKRIMNGEKTVIHAELEAEDGYRADRGTVKALIKDGQNEQTVVGKRQKDGAYTFEIPDSISENATVEIQAEFEMGKDDPDMPSVSAGVSVAVNVVQSCNSAVVKGGSVIEAGEGLSLTAETEKADSTAKAIAGYSEGNIGIGGAVSVNVASAKTTSKIYNAADRATEITLGGGDFELSANAGVHFGTKADAEGEDPAAAAGVGAGVAVAVTGADAVAAVQDNVKFSLADEDAALDSVRVIAAQKVKDAIVARLAARAACPSCPFWPWTSPAAARWPTWAGWTATLFPWAAKMSCAKPMN